MTTPNPAELARTLRDLEAKATPGPWYESVARHSPTPTPQVVRSEASVNFCTDIVAHCTKAGDNALICALLNNLPALLAALKDAERLEWIAENVTELRGHSPSQPRMTHPDYAGLRYCPWSVSVIRGEWPNQSWDLACQGEVHRDGPLAGLRDSVDKARAVCAKWDARDAAVDAGKERP